MIDDLLAFVEAARRVSVSLAALPVLAEPVFDHVLDQGNRWSRARFVRCDGCEDCASPLPVLTGEADHLP